LHCTASFSYTQDMFTLHDTIELTKKILLYGTLAVIGIVILILLFRFGGFLKEKIFPTPPPAAKVGFGKLPAITFPKRTTKQDFVYALDTLSGTFPILADRAFVYKLDMPNPTFFDVERARTKAKNIGFTGTPVSVGENMYEWVDNKELQRRLIMNTVLKDFLLTSSFRTYSPVVSRINLPDTGEAKKDAISFLKTLNSYPDTINEASTSAQLLAIQNDELIEASSFSNTQLIRFDFYPQVVNQLPIYFPNSPRSLIYVIIGGGQGKSTVVEAQFKNRELSEDFSDYPIKTAQAAFTELEAGRGYIASYFGTSTDIKIQNISLGYYLGEDMQEYLMPIIVFEGDNGFLAYVSAVQDNFIE